MGYADRSSHAVTNLFPRLLQLGSFSIYSYGFFVAIGAWVGISISSRNAERRGLDPNKAWNLGLLMVLAGFLGAKILLVLNEWNYYLQNPRELLSLSMLQAGGVFSGGLIGALLAAAWYIHRHRMPLLRTADCFAPGLALSHVFGRLGCFSAGCCYGKATHAAWGVVFSNPLANRLAGTPLGIALHPTQLIESGVELLNFLLLSQLFNRKLREGRVFAAYLVVYGVARFFIEYLRGDPGRGEVFGGLLSGTQLISLLLVAGGGLLWLRREQSTLVVRSVS